MAVKTWDADVTALIPGFEAKFGPVVRQKVKSRQKHAGVSAETRFAQAWESDPLPGFVIEREYQFHAERRWRFDFAFVAQRVAVEIDGRGMGSEAGGHHTVGGALRDAEKQNHACALGWRVLHLPTTELKQRMPVWLQLVKGALRYNEDSEA